MKRVVLSAVFTALALCSCAPRPPETQTAGVWALAQISEEALPQPSAIDGAVNEAGVTGGQSRSGLCVTQGKSVYFVRPAVNSDEFCIWRFDAETGGVEKITRAAPPENEPFGIKDCINVREGGVFYPGVRGLYEAPASGGEARARVRLLFSGAPFVMLPDGYIYCSETSQDPRIVDALHPDDSVFVGSLLRAQYGAGGDERREWETLIDQGMLSGYFVYDSGRFYALDKLDKALCSVLPDGSDRRRLGVFPEKPKGWFVQDGSAYYEYEGAICRSEAAGGSGDGDPLGSVANRIGALPAGGRADMEILTEKLDDIAFYGVSGGGLYVVQYGGGLLDVSRYPLEGGEKIELLKGARLHESVYDYALGEDALFIYGSEGCALINANNMTLTMLAPC